MNKQEEARLVQDLRERFWYHLMNHSIRGRVSSDNLQSFVSSQYFRVTNRRAKGNAFLYLGRAIQELFSRKHVVYDSSTYEYTFDEETTRDIEQMRDMNEEAQKRGYGADY